MWKSEFITFCAGSAARKVAPVASKSRLLAHKKPAAKKGGLGVSKMTAKVDESLFDQPPAEDPPAVVPGVPLMVSDNA